MTEVQTCSAQQLKPKLESWKPSVVVSAHPVGPVEGAELVAVPIEDIYNVQLGAYKAAIRRVLAVDGERILVQCQHGQSRSTALAIAKLWQLGGEDRVATFLRNNPDAQPNPLLLLFADEILEANGELLSVCSQSYKGRNL